MKKDIHAELILTHNCNFRCKYCYEKCFEYKNVDMKPEVLEKTEEYIESYLKKYSDRITIDFWGGEPSLKPDIINYFINKYIDNDRVYFSIFSNGYNINPIYESILKCNRKSKNKLYTQISFDYGLQNKRVLINENSTYDKVLDTIKRIHKDGVFYSTKSTIGFNDLDKIEIMYDDLCRVNEQLLEINKNNRISDLALTVDTMAIWNNTDTDFDSKLEIFKAQLKNIIRKDLKKKQGFNWFRFQKNKCFCGSGQGVFSIDIDGNIYNCHGAIFTECKQDHKRGNILEFNENSDHFGYFLPFKTEELDENCKKCTSIFCFKCNVHCYETSKKETYKERWFDYSNREKYCKIQKEISNHILAYNKIINQRKN